jgi:hypothetical protein
MAAFQTLLGLEAGRKPKVYNKIRGVADFTRAIAVGLLKQQDKQKSARC